MLFMILAYCTPYCILIFQTAVTKFRKPKKSKMFTKKKFETGR